MGAPSLDEGVYRQDKAHMYVIDFGAQFLSTKIPRRCCRYVTASCGHILLMHCAGQDPIMDVSSISLYADKRTISWEHRHLMKAFTGKIKHTCMLSTLARSS